MSKASINRKPNAAGHSSARPPPIRNWMDARLDFARAVPLRKSYVVASTYRCGSTFFCSYLWKTGVAGAPAEYLNIGETRMLRDIMMRRLQVHLPEDYLAKLLACRTSRNGVFGMKVLFNHFEAALSWCPSMMSTLSPETFVFLDRKDRLAQAVSMAKAVQSDVWSSLESNSQATLTYDEALIVKCLKDIELQNLGWSRWFKTNNIKPLIIYYEDAVTDIAGVVRSVVELLGVENDQAEKVDLPHIEKLSDETNIEWLTRFRQRDHWLELDGYIGGIAPGYES